MKYVYCNVKENIPQKNCIFVSDTTVVLHCNCVQGVIKHNIALGVFNSCFILSVATTLPSDKFMSMTGILIHLTCNIIIQMSCLYISGLSHDNVCFKVCVLFLHQMLIHRARSHAQPGWMTEHWCQLGKTATPKYGA